jgi:uncharacterized membrane protein
VIRERLSPIWRAEEARPIAPAGSRAPYVVLALVTIVFAAVFSWLSVARHTAFQSHAFDLGNMDQAVWNTLHGHLLRFTDMDVGHAILTSRLAIHVEPVLVLFAPLYLLHSGPETLLVAQALVVATGAVPAYLLAREVLGRPWVSLIFPVAYLLHPSLQNVLLDDFHAVALSAAFLLWAIYFFCRSQVVPFAAFAALSMATKEEVGLVIACLGIWALVRRQPLTGIICLLGGIGWFLISVALIIPHFNPSGHSPYLARYSYLGHGLSGIVRGAVHRPDLVLHTLRSEPRLQYVLDLIHPLGFTPLLALPVLAIAAPILLINMLSTDATMYSGFYQYSAETVPIVVVASILGIAWLDRRSPGSRREVHSALAPTLCFLVLVASLVDSRLYGFTPLAAGYLLPTSGPHQTLETQTLALIPAQAVVAAADEIEPHLSDRPWIYLLPTIHPVNGPPARFLVLDASVPSLPVSPRRLHSVTRAALRHGYGIRSASDGILLLERGRPGHTLPPAFYSFMFRQSTHLQALDVRWGPLRLTAAVVHPRSGETNRARPAIGLETYWRTETRLPPGARIAFHLSPTYTGPHPAYGAGWVTETDSPTWDWLPLPSWPLDRTVRADSLSLLPVADSWGTVDVAISVSGLGPAHPSTAAGTVIAPNVVRIGSITVRP